MQPATHPRAGSRTTKRGRAVKRRIVQDFVSSGGESDYQPESEEEEAEEEEEEEYVRRPRARARRAGGAAAGQAPQASASKASSR